MFQKLQLKDIHQIYEYTFCCFHNRQDKQTHNIIYCMYEYIKRHGGNGVLCELGAWALTTASKSKFICKCCCLIFLGGVTLYE